jgi:hypothetical protein
MAKPALGKIMSADDKSKNTAAKKEPVTESKAADATPKTEGAKTEAAKAEGARPEAAKADAAPANKGMGEGQKPVSQAYKDNWNAIFGKKTAKKPMKKPAKKKTAKKTVRKAVKKKKKTLKKTRR